MSDVVGSLDFKPHFFDLDDWKRRAKFVLVPTLLLLLGFLLVTSGFGDAGARSRLESKPARWWRTDD